MQVTSIVHLQLILYNYCISLFFIQDMQENKMQEYVLESVFCLQVLMLLLMFFLG